MTRSLTARRSIAAAALTPLLLTGLAACGDDSGGDASGTDSSGTSALASVSEGDEVKPADFVAAVSDGIESSTTAHMTMSVSLGSAGKLTGEGDVDYTGDPPEMAMTMSMPAMGGQSGGMDADMRFVDGIMYMKMGQLTQDKFWKIDPSDPNNPLGASGLGEMLDQMNPAESMKKMESGIDKVTYVGEEDVDGRTLDHYTMTVDLQEMLDSMGQDVPSSALGQMPKTLAYDVWLDDQGRFGQMTADIPMGGQQATMEMTADDWGDEVDIEAPPADQVTDMPDMGSMMGGGQASPMA